MAATRPWPPARQLNTHLELLLMPMVDRLKRIRGDALQRHCDLYATDRVGNGMGPEFNVDHDNFLFKLTEVDPCLLCSTVSS